MFYNLIPNNIEERSASLAASPLSAANSQNSDLSIPAAIDSNLRLGNNMKENLENESQYELGLVVEFFESLNYPISNITDRIITVDSVELESEYVNFAIQDRPEEDCIRFVVEDGSRYPAESKVAIEEFVHRINTVKPEIWFSLEADGAFKLHSNVKYGKILLGELENIVYFLHALFLAHRKLADAIAHGMSVEKAVMLIRQIAA